MAIEDRAKVDRAARARRKRWIAGLKHMASILGKGDSWVFWWMTEKWSKKQLPSQESWAAIKPRRCKEAEEFVTRLSQRKGRV